MATRSTIAIERENGSVARIYCHWDGYPEHNGVILTEHYTDAAKIEELISLGDLSVLGSEIGYQHPFNSSEQTKEYENFCLAYGRDRGETGIEARVFASFESSLVDRFEEYNYIFRNGEWFVRSQYDNKGYVPVAGLLKEAA